MTMNKTITWFLISVLALAATTTSARVWIYHNPDIADLKSSRDDAKEDREYIRNKVDKIYEELKQTREELARQYGRRDS